ncbi:MAG: HAD-IA family hydrolase [Spirochaetaceae bacterium]|nr:HAD-IA family hydrolase [Spirochaetaceae bacterium]
MENKYKVVIFDLDGTLMNTSPGIFTTANWTMKQLGKPIETDLKQLAKFVGPPLKECFKVTFDLEDELIEKACIIFRKGYEEHGKHLAIPYEGMADLLKNLNDNNIICSVATMKYESPARDMIIEQDLDKYFKLVYGSDFEGLKTKGSIIIQILNELQVDKNEAVLIGDTLHDLRGASEAGIDFIGVSYGFGFTPDYEITDQMIALCANPKDVLKEIIK